MPKLISTAITALDGMSRTPTRVRVGGPDEEVTRSSTRGSGSIVTYSATGAGLRNDGLLGTRRTGARICEPFRDARRESGGGLRRSSTSGPPRSMDLKNEIERELGEGADGEPETGIESLKMTIGAPVLPARRRRSALLTKGVSCSSTGRRGWRKTCTCRGSTCWWKP